jgi:serine/threonine protein kinase
MSRRKHGRRKARRAPARQLGLNGPCGRYEVIRPLGTGGMAEVFQARVKGPAGFQRDVVIKRLRADRGEDADFVGMLADEARILGSLHHQNIVSALDFGEQDGSFFLVLEYVAGPSLARLLRSGERKIPAAIVAYVGREICRALDYMHRFEDADGTALQLIHRDVTPSNVIVTPTGTVKLLDFGIAKFATATQLTASGMVKGKSAYLAPEQLEAGRPIDGRVDLFALGVVLHELLTQERLFADATDLGTMKRILGMEIPLPSRKSPGVPPELDRIVMKALERDPSRRYASAAEMARDLDEVILAAHLRVDEVAAFVDGLGTPAASKPPAIPAAALRGRRPAPPTVDVHSAPTLRDLRLPLRMWMGAGRRGTLVAGLSVALGLASALGLGMRFRTPRGPEGALMRPPTAECRARVQASAPLASSAQPVNSAF